MNTSRLFLLIEMFSSQFLINGAKWAGTLVEPGKIRNDMLSDILKMVYCEVAPKRLSDLIDKPDNLADL